MNTEQARFNMIEQQIRPWEVLDAHVLSLLATVRREDFVPPALRALAFVDTQVPLLPGSPTARTCWSRASRPACCRN
jgi:protein-L-isoaspartate(D-aspartate) O-methyltransferase